MKQLQYVTLADKDPMKPELRHYLYQRVSAKNALINKYLKKIAEKAEFTTNLTMHISRHAFAHIAHDSGAKSSTIKNILGHSHLARRTFIGNLYKKVKDPNLVGSLSGHKEGSTLYRDIDEDMKKELVSLLD